MNYTLKQEKEQEQEQKQDKNITKIFYRNKLKTNYIHVNKLASINGVFIPGQLWEDIKEQYLIKQTRNNKPNNIELINKYNNTGHNLNLIKSYEPNKFKLVHNNLPLYGFINGISANNEIVYFIKMNEVKNNRILQFKYQAHIQGLLEIIYSYGIVMNCLLIDIDDITNTEIITRSPTYFNCNLERRVIDFYNKLKK